MKCKACNATLSPSEQQWDDRRNSLNDMCGNCLASSGFDSRNPQLQVQGIPLSLEEALEEQTEILVEETTTNDTI